MDNVSKDVRSRMMASIRSSNTAPEMKVRKLLHKNGFRYRLHPRELPGRPDVVLPRYRLCIFIHGCFWHRHTECRYATNPSSREDFWRSKFEQNVKRDTKNRSALLEQGWRVFELWECGIRKPEAELEWLLEAVENCNQQYISWPSLPTVTTR
ncbi:DNA mismatch endonuclease Vsr [Pseudomonas lactis]|uniref:very short patch repair endonuclease n=1 Tax=Pseudomonas lactis TaxID=1615674 RepID=UPI001295D631|nr:very short patch repair endonuclease [Pseudomonas lactis]MQB16227.1 DNA mismatch endonuclease Vsr [Pseudomonas lactis]